MKIAAADTPTKKKRIYRTRAKGKKRGLKFSPERRKVNLYRGKCLSYTEYSTNIPEEEDGEKMSSALSKNKNRLCSKACGKDKLIQMNFKLKKSLKIPTGFYPKKNLKS